MSQTKEQIKANISRNITTNGVGDITGEVMRRVLNNMTDNLATEYAGYQYAGIAVLTPSQTDPGTPDGKVFYVATEAGTYTNFSGLTVSEGEVAVLKYNGTAWSKDVTGAATKAELDQLGQLVNTGYKYMGNATPATTPVTDKGKVFYITSQAGTYTNFGNLVVADGEVAVLKYNGTAWSKDVTGAATKDELNRLGQKIETPATITNKLEFPYFGYYKTDHSYVDDTTGDKLTKYIEVQEGWEILVNISPDDGVIYTIVAFNSALEVVWDKCVSGNKVNYTYIVPSGIKYLRFGTRAGSAYLTSASVKFPISFAAIKDYVDGEVADLETSINNTEADITKKTSLIRLTYTTSKQATRLLVPASLRQQGLVITYFNGFERVIEEFVLDGSESGNFNDAYWQQNSSWQPVYGLNCEHENTMASLFQNSMLSLVKEWRVGYFMADGSVGISEGLRISDYIPVTSGKTYKIVALSDGEGKPAIVCYDSSYNIVETVLATSGLFYVGEYTIPSGVSYIRICKRNINASSFYDTAKYAGVWESIPMQEIHPEILKQFSDVDGALYYNGSPITSELSNVVTDLPVSDGTGIESGYAYIDSTDRTIKVKA